MLQLDSVTLFFKSSLLRSSKAVLVCSRTMKKEDFTQKRVCDNGSDHHKPAAHLTHVHSVLDSSQNHSSSLQELYNTRNCSLFNNIPLPSVGKEMPLSFSESAGTNSSAAAPWKDSFHLHFSSRKDSLDRVSHCIDGISVTGCLEEARSISGDFSSCCPGDNFVCFAQFWLGDLQYNKNLWFLELEMSSSKENELQFAFFKALELGGLPDPCSNPVASPNSYAMGLINNQKPCFFLCYLNLVSSEQTLGYEQMLLNIQWVTNTFPIIQLVISVLAFALAGLWYAVVKLTGLAWNILCCMSFGNYMFWEPQLYTGTCSYTLFVCDMLGLVLRCLMLVPHLNIILIFLSTTTDQENSLDYLLEMVWILSYLPSSGKALQSKEQGHDFVSHENLAVLIIHVLLDTTSSRNTRMQP